MIGGGDEIAPPAAWLPPESPCSMADCAVPALGVCAEVRPKGEPPGGGPGPGAASACGRRRSWDAPWWRWPP